MDGMDFKDGAQSFEWKYLAEHISQTRLLALCCHTGYISLVIAGLRGIPPPSSPLPF